MPGEGELIDLREICTSLGSGGARDKGRCWGELMKFLLHSWLRPDGICGVCMWDEGSRWGSSVTCGGMSLAAGARRARLACGTSNYYSVIINTHDITNCRLIDLFLATAPPL